MSPVRNTALAKYMINENNHMGLDHLGIVVVMVDFFAGLSVMVWVLKIVFKSVLKIELQLARI